MSVNKRFSLISRTHISKSHRRFNVKSSKYYFHMKTKIMAVFQISISIPLNSGNIGYLYPSYHNFCVCMCVCVCVCVCVCCVCVFDLHPLWFLSKKGRAHDFSCDFTLFLLITPTVEIEKIEWRKFQVIWSILGNQQKFKVKDLGKYILMFSKPYRPSVVNSMSLT